MILPESSFSFPSHSWLYSTKSPHQSYGKLGRCFVSVGSVYCSMTWKRVSETPVSVNHVLVYPGVWSLYTDTLNWIWKYPRNRPDLILVYTNRTSSLCTQRNHHCRDYLYNIEIWSVRSHDMEVNTTWTPWTTDPKFLLLPQKRNLVSSQNPTL